MVLFFFDRFDYVAFKFNDLGSEIIEVLVQHPGHVLQQSLSLLRRCSAYGALQLWDHRHDNSSDFLLVKCNLRSEGVLEMRDSAYHSFNTFDLLLLLPLNNVWLVKDLAEEVIHLKHRFSELRLDKGNF